MCKLYDFLHIVSHQLFNCKNLLLLSNEMNNATALIVSQIWQILNDLSHHIQNPCKSEDIR